MHCLACLNAISSTTFHKNDFIEKHEKSLGEIIFQISGIDTKPLKQEFLCAICSGKVLSTYEFILQMRATIERIKQLDEISLFEEVSMDVVEFKPNIESLETEADNLAFEQQDEADKSNKYSIIEYSIEADNQCGNQNNALKSSRKLKRRHDTETYRVRNMKYRKGRSEKQETTDYSYSEDEVDKKSVQRDFVESGRMLRSRTSIEHHEDIATMCNSLSVIGQSFDTSHNDVLKATKVETTEKRTRLRSQNSAGKAENTFKERVKNKLAEKYKRYRDKLKDNPEKYAEHKFKAKERAIKYREKQRQLLKDNDKLKKAKNALNSKRQKKFKEKKKAGLKAVIGEPYSCKQTKIKVECDMPFMY